MAAFEYTALDAHGREVRGVQEGESPRQVRQWLRDQQLLPMQVTAVTNSNVTQRGLGKRSSFTRNRISNADLALLTRQLATLVKAALPLEDAIQNNKQKRCNESLRRTRKLYGFSKSV